MWHRDSRLILRALLHLHENLSVYAKVETFSALLLHPTVQSVISINNTNLCP